MKGGNALILSVKHLKDLLERIFWSEPLHYIGGSDTLPPPLPRGGQRSWPPHFVPGGSQALPILWDVPKR